MQMKITENLYKFGKFASQNTYMQAQRYNQHISDMSQTLIGIHKINSRNAIPS